MERDGDSEIREDVMAKIRVVAGGASFEAEGDEDACAMSLKLFHLAVAEDNLRTVETKLSELKALQKQRRDLVDTIDRLKRELV